MGWILAILLLTAPAALAGEMQRIVEKGELVVSLNRNTPPFCMEAKGQLVGLDVDLARLMADALGVKLKFIFPAAYEAQIPKLLAGESDIVIAAMTRTPERGLQVNFSAPYFEVSQAALVHTKLVTPQVQSYFDLVDIPGVRIGVKQQTTMERFARKLFSAERVKPYAGHDEAVDALLQGEVDATVHDSPYVRVWQRRHPELSGTIKALLAPTTKEHYGFAIRKGDPDFLAWLNLFIAQAESDGTMDLLKHIYLVEMAWLGQPQGQGSALDKEHLMRNKFLAQKMEMLERQRREEMKKAGAQY
ncbi:MAG: transporter substrate-binding domain-containing protein [Desulfatitalea sp.]|nr:transporter substrate-binding domain-containing protein [Desulfatitalea sp.]